MVTFDYDAWLKTAEDRLETLYEQKSSIEAEISALEDGIQGFAPLVSRVSRWHDPDAGITDAVRSVLKAEPSRIFTPTEIRDVLARRGTPLTQRNPMANIHQVLARLVQKETVRITPYENGRNRYQWAEKTKTTEAHKGRLAQEKEAEVMRMAGSEVGTPLSVETEDERRSRKKK